MPDKGMFEKDKIRMHLAQVRDENEFKNAGGNWLARARSWMQTNCINGSDVTWGSDEALRTTHGPLTVKDVETIAKEVAWAAVEEYKRTQPEKGVL